MERNCRAQVLLLTIFGLVGLRTAAEGLSVFLLLGCLVNLVGHQVFVFSVYITPIQDAALILGIMYCMLSLLVAGFFVKWRDMQPFWRWISYATPCRYGVSGIVNELLQVPPLLHPPSLSVRPSVACLSVRQSVRCLSVCACVRACLRVDMCGSTVMCARARACECVRVHESIRV